MTNSPTIDGVSRGLIEMTIDLLQDLRRNTAVERKLRALLDAPAVERQEPDFWEWLDSAYRDGSKGENPKFTKYNMEVAYHAGSAALQSTIARLEARIAELESGRGEPVAVVTSVVSRKNKRFEIEILDNQKLHVGTWLYTAPPAPVAVVPTTEQFCEAFVSSGYVDEAQAEDLAEIATRAGLDATAALNTVHVDELDPGQRLALARGDSFIAEITGDWDKGWTFIDANKTSKGQGVCFAFPPGTVLKW